MKNVKTACYALVCLFLGFCGGTENPGKIRQTIRSEFNSGNFRKMNLLADSVRKIVPGDTALLVYIDSLKEMAHRISLDFRFSEAEITEKLQTAMGDYTGEERQKWERNNWLEWKMIDGEKRYFKRAVSNLKLILAFHEKAAAGQLNTQPDETALFRIAHARKVLLADSGRGNPVLPTGIKMRYSITTDSGAVPAGEVIRCWMPYPHENHARQQNVKLIRTFPEKHFLAPDSAGQRSLYFEQTAVGGEPARFEMELEYRSSAQYFDLTKFKIKPYDTTTILYRKYTAEEKPHVVFTPAIKKLSDSIVGNTTDPKEVVRRIFYWIDARIPWAGALEYSTMPDIPGYVIQNRHGDCGMVTLLFMTLARYNGIPVKWQSGWMVPPGNVNLHDWCEVYYEGAGWVPLDMSYGRLPSGEPGTGDFYMSGIDAYRLIVNDATATPFIPAKKFMRSETVDFQRGELEWRGGNLYFDKWSYDMKVSYF